MGNKDPKNKANKKAIKNASKATQKQINKADQKDDDEIIVKTGREGCEQVFSKKYTQNLPNESQKKVKRTNEDSREDKTKQSVCQPNQKNQKIVPQCVQKLVNRYMNLEINGKIIQTPYYRNVKRVRAGLRVLVGKGTPQEIEEETLIYAKLRKVDLNALDPKGVREFMLQEGIGVDCSGLVSQLLHKWFKQAKKGAISRNINYPSKSLYRKLLTLLRPIESTGADILTNDQNTKKIALSEILPGDLIREKGIPRGDHVLMIYSVQYASQKPQSFVYVHSSDKFNGKSGVKFGKVEIIDLKKDLKDQKWLEKNDKNEKPAYNQLMKDYKDNGLRRLKSLEKLQVEIYRA
jgi:hypothetical protein